MFPCWQLVRSSASRRCPEVVWRPSGTQMSPEVKSQSSSASLEECTSQLALAPGPTPALHWVEKVASHSLALPGWKMGEGKSPTAC